MELRHLSCFVCVADEHSFSRAASRLHVVQSAVSASIQALEADLGVRLLERSSKHVALTDAGAALLPRARAVLDAAQAARDAVDQVRGGLRGSLSVGTMTSVGVLDLPALLGGFHRRYPDVEVRLAMAPQGTRGLVQQLLAGALDLALVSLPGNVPAGIHRRRLASMPLAVIVPEGHRLAGREAASLADLADEAFVDFPLGYGNRAVVDHAFALAEIRRRVALEVWDFGTAAAVVRSGLGVAIMPRLAAEGVGGIRVLRVADGDLKWPLDVATSATRVPSGASRAFLALLDDHVRGTAGAAAGGGGIGW